VSRLFSVDFKPGLRNFVAGSDLFGREEDIAFLDAAWANPDVNVVTLYVIDSGWAKRSAGRRDYA
jgi:hypothetical protein